jgi:hypothetical protein
MLVLASDDCAPQLYDQSAGVLQLTAVREHWLAMLINGLDSSARLPMHQLQYRMLSDITS